MEIPSVTYEEKKKSKFRLYCSCCCLYQNKEMATTERSSVHWVCSSVYVPRLRHGSLCAPSARIYFRKLLSTGEQTEGCSLGRGCLSLFGEN